MQPINKNSYISKHIQYFFNKRFLSKGLGVISAVLLLLATLIYFYAPLFIIEIKNPVIETARTCLTSEHIEQKTDNKNLINFYWQGTGEVELNADLYFAMRQPAKATLILLHGIRSHKETWQNIVRYLQQQGFNAVTVDLRAHGNSKGEYCTFGYYEKQDISALIDVLQKRFHIHTPIGIWGHSLGGAIAVQCLAVDKRIQFGIVESAYADFAQITQKYSKDYLSFEATSFNEFLLERAGEIARFNPTEVNPQDYAFFITQPVLLLHGTEDKKINPANSQKIFEALRSSHKEIIQIENANHYDIWQKGGKKLHKKIVDFIEKSLIVS